MCSVALIGDHAAMQGYSIALMDQLSGMKAALMGGKILFRDWLSCVTTAKDMCGASRWQLGDGASVTTVSLAKVWQAAYSSQRFDLPICFGGRP
jgi:hypothetical protein